MIKVKFDRKRNISLRKVKVDKWGLNKRFMMAW